MTTQPTPDNAPQWNCVGFPDKPGQVGGMHYFPGDTCAWCGKSRKQADKDYNAAVAGKAVPIPDTAFYRQMRQGHINRTGHALTGELVTDDGEIWRLLRSCCDSE